MSPTISDVAAKVVSPNLQGIPLLLVDNHCEKVNNVVTDNCEWFCDLSFSESSEGYKLALKEHHIPFDESLTADGLPREPSGYIAMKRLLERAIPPPFLLPTTRQR